MVAVDTARRRFAEGAHDEAIAMLEKIQPASEPLVIAGLEELKRARAAATERQRAEAERAERLERQQRVAKLIDEARALIEGQSIEAAQARLDAARAIDASHPEIDLLWNRAEGHRLEQQRRAAAAEAERLEQQRRDAAAEAIREDEQRREERQRQVAEAERLRQERRDAAAEARRQEQEQERRETEATLRRVPQPAPEPTLKKLEPEPTLKRLEPEPTLKRQEPRTREERHASAPLPKQLHPADHAQRPLIDAHIAQAAKLAQRHEYRMAIVELEAALALKPDHTGLNTLIAKMREAEAKRQRESKPLADMTLQRDRPAEVVTAQASRPSSLIGRYSKTTLIAGGAVAILVAAAIIWLLANL
jgi:colicin import membrane protein